MSKFRLIEKAKDRPKIGLGAPVPEVDGFVRAINEARDCPLYNMPVIEQVRWTMAGPQTSQSITENWGAEIDLFGSGKSPTGIDFVETTMAQPGVTQTYMITCAIGLQLEPEPLEFSIIGNSFTHPAAAAAEPASPNVFTANDITNAALNSSAVPATLWWGGWWNYAFWHLVRGYNLRWRIGQHTNIMDEVARHTAYMPTNAQEGSSSSSNVPVDDFVRQVNDYYDANLASTQNFAKTNFIRVGSATVGGVNVGSFTPTRTFDLAPATYGGIGLRSLLKGNSEFRTLTVPYLIKPGVPIGLILQQNDTIQGNAMRRYLSALQGQTGTVPPAVTDEANWNSGNTATGANVMLEQTLDSPPVNVAQQVLSQRAIYKGGEAKVTLSVKGFEVSEDWAQALIGNSVLRQAVMSATGLAYASMGG